MKSIFDLAESSNDLPSMNQGMARMIYEQHPPTRDVTGTNFPNGSIHIRWQVSGNRWWVPRRSYIRMRAGLFKADGVTPVDLSDDVAPNMGLMSNLFQSMEFRIADKTVSRVSDFVPQVDALRKRLGKSKSWLDTVGKFNWWQSSAAVRQSEVASDGDLPSKIDGYAGQVQDPETKGFTANNNNMSYTAATKLLTFAVNGGGPVDIEAGLQTLKPGDVIVGQAAAFAGYVWKVLSVNSATVATAQLLKSPVGGDANVAATVLATAAFAVNNLIFFRDEVKLPRRNGFEMVWQPPLSIFDVGHAMPSGKYELVLNPQNRSVYEKYAIESLIEDQDAPADFRFIIEDMYLYLNTVEGKRVDDKAYMMSLNEVRCQTDSVDNSTGIIQKTFDVSPSTMALTMAFQDTTVSSDTLFSSTKYKIREVSSGAADPLLSADLKLIRFFLNYNGVNKPQPDADPQFVSPNNYLTQRYADSLFYSGGYNDTGGCETEAEWRERGPYYHFAWPRDGFSQSTRVSSNFQFAHAIGEGIARVLIFDHFTRVAQIVVSDGRVIDVKLQDA